ncbi:MAG: hypothetical protein ACRDD7_11580 [Peptostreptococcaceae bacterium]
MKLSKDCLVNIFMILCIILTVIGKITIFQLIAIYFIVEALDSMINAYSLWKKENKKIILKDGIKIVMCLFIAIVTCAKFI